MRPAALALVPVLAAAVGGAGAPSPSGKRVQALRAGSIEFVALHPTG